MARTAGKGGYQFGRGRCVAESDGDIAQPSFIADAPNGAAASLLQELGLAPCKQIGELRVIESVPSREILFRCGARKLVPRTYQLAIIAAVDAIADGAAKLNGNRSAELNGQVGNAASSVKTVRCDDGTGRAGGHAGATRAAVRAALAVDGQFQVEVDLAQKKIGSGVAIDQIRMLADPPQPGVARQGLLQNRCAVGEHPVAEMAYRLLDAIAEFL